MTGGGKRDHCRGSQFLWKGAGGGMHLAGVVALNIAHGSSRGTQSSPPRSLHQDAAAGWGGGPR